MLGTSSYALTASYVQNAQSASYVLNAVSSSFAITASYALNGGVTQLLAGPNVLLSPTNGLGQVTISSTSGGGGFNTATGSYGSFYDTTTQTNLVANIPRSMSLNTTDITNGVSISGSISPFNTYIKTENAGVYNIQFSAQLDKTDSGTDEIVIWLRKNGINLTDTATTVTLVGNNSKQVAAWNWFVNSAANDYYQIIWQSADTNVRLLAEPADGHPGIPSVIVTANRVDQFLSNTGSFSGSFVGIATTASFAQTASYVQNAQNAFLQYINKATSGFTSIVGVGSGISYSYEIEADTIKVGDIATADLFVDRTGGTGNMTIRFYFNTTNSISGAILAGTATYANTNLYAGITRTFSVESSTVTNAFNAGATSSGDIPTGGTSAMSALNIDWSVARWIIIHISMAGTGSATVKMFRFYK